MLISAELHWFWRAACPPHVERWFHEGAAFRSTPEARCDRYSPQPGKQDIGIKLRGGKEAAEVKARIAIVSDPLLAAIAPTFEIWGKWDAALPIGETIEVNKLRSLRAFDVEGPEVAEVPLSPAALEAHLELTSLEVMNTTWWTLGLEAMGTLAEVSPKLHKLAKHLCVGALPIEGGDFLSYPAWLDRVTSKG